MESLLIHPENAEQLQTIKAFLKALKVPFEQQADTLPQHVKKSIKKSISQFESGQTISLQEFTDRHFSQK